MLCERLCIDEGVSLKYFNTTTSMVDILTIASPWVHMNNLYCLGTPEPQQQQEQLQQQPKGPSRKRSAKLQLADDGSRSSQIAARAARSPQVPRDGDRSSQSSQVTRSGASSPQVAENGDRLAQVAAVGARLSQVAPVCSVSRSPWRDGRFWDHSLRLWFPNL